VSHPAKRFYSERPRKHHPSKPPHSEPEHPREPYRVSEALKAIDAVLASLKGPERAVPHRLLEALKTLDTVLDRLNGPLVDDR